LVIGDYLLGKGKVSGQWSMVNGQWSMVIRLENEEGAFFISDACGLSQAALPLHLKLPT
jgi:hypothetical protein